ncbi:MAG: fimbrillin family protein [Bacteroidaceae bacterium]|nr:fimbrillin family protein [Bacteroidaceae bacterium]
MKKNYIIIAVVAAMMASCSDNVKLTNELAEKTKTDKIGFAVYSEKTTRGSDANSTVLEDFHKTFDVYAWKFIGTEDQEVFNHTPVAYFATSTSTSDYVYVNSSPEEEWGTDWASNTDFKGWFYENIRYWDKLATYKFFAIAPYEATPDPSLTISKTSTNFSIGDDSHKYDISNEVNKADFTTDKKYFGFNKDYMIADMNETRIGLVTLNFHHILTKLNVKISIQDTYTGKQEVTIKDLKIDGLESNGYFTYGGMTTNGWTTSGSYDITVPDDKTIKNAPSNGTNYSGCYWIQTLIFPQTLTCMAEGVKSTAPSGKYLYIEYSIGNETFKAYYDLAYVFNNTLRPEIAQVDWSDEELAEDASRQGTHKVEAAAAGTYPLAQGSEYTLNIKVGPEPIVFDAIATGWADQAENNHSVD